MRIDGEKKKTGLVSNTVVTSVRGHFGSHGVENRKLPLWMSSLPEPSLLCFHPPVFLSGNQIQKTVRNSVQTVDGVIVQTSITNVNVDEGVFHFISFSSLFPLSCPCHSIRLDYGCVVVDTFSMWLVSWCCSFMVLCSS